MAQQSTREWTLWVVAVSCALHATEEYLTGWQAWAAGALGIMAPTSWFVVMNGILVALAFRFAAAGWQMPSLSLVIPSATLVNGVLFHILPTILMGQVSPGVYTATLLYLPFSSWALVGAKRDGVPVRAIVRGVVGGTAIMLGVVVVVRWLS